MANQDSGAGQQYDEDITSDQWAQQGGQQVDEQDIEGVMSDMPRGGNVGRQPQQRDDMGEQEQWEQEQRGLRGRPFSPLDEVPLEEPLEEDEEEWQEEEDISEIDQME